MLGELDCIKDRCHRRKKKDHNIQSGVANVFEHRALLARYYRSQFEECMWAYIAGAE
jgi:ribosomal protein S15P/S13E